MSHEPVTPLSVSPGLPYPLGASVTDDGVNFAVYSRHAEAIHLVLFDSPEGEAILSIPLTARSGFVWHGLVHGLKAGQLYGLRAQGPYQPEKGLRFNSHKLLIDPYAKSLVGRFSNKDGLLLGYTPGGADADLTFDTRPSDGGMPKCLVHGMPFDWQGVEPPRLRPSELVIYEVHLKGFTRDPSSGVENPGTYLGFLEKIPHLKSLGINAVEFLPLQAFYSEDFLADRGLTNYWGYNTVGFFAPHPQYGSGSYPGCEVEEFKTLVRELHRAGIAVILDVVYNHTAEGNEFGPTLSFRGLDNPGYYTLPEEGSHAGRGYMNYTGTGNTVNFGHKGVTRLCLDSLRYWVEEMRVDGFRFDLATVHGRSFRVDFDKEAAFFTAIAQDPVLARSILIAEPWDMEAYEVGGFPEEWSEWNGKFRDTARRFWKGESVSSEEWRARFTASPDVFPPVQGRMPYHSVNFITCHDGFTLMDLVSYEAKHNEANGEDNRDGNDHNISVNCGHEGPTEDEAVNRLRWKLAKNHFCTLFFSHGIPMILGGDEMLRTQGGNNNAYCQDNPISWFDWGMAESHGFAIRFVRNLLRVRSAFPVFTCPMPWSEVGEDFLRWLFPDSIPSAPEPSGAQGCLLGPHPEWTGGATLLLLFNPSSVEASFTLPDIEEDRRWYGLIDTAREDIPADDIPLSSPLEGTGRMVLVPSRSFAFLAALASQLETPAL